VALRVEPARVPTREEIQRNIDQHRQSRKAPRFGENMSMASAFQGGMGSLVEAVGGEMGVHLAARVRAMAGSAVNQPSRGPQSLEGAIVKCTETLLRALYRRVCDLRRPAAGGWGDEWGIVTSFVLCVNDLRRRLRRRRHLHLRAHSCAYYCSSRCSYSP
jgi:hypothetical protein